MKVNIFSPFVVSPAHSFLLFSSYQHIKVSTIHNKSIHQYDTTFQIDANKTKELDLKMSLKEKRE